VIRLAWLALASCSFHPGTLADPSRDDATTDTTTIIDDDATVDTSTDATPTPSVCATNPNVLVCLSFDAQSFFSTMSNEGTANVTAQLTSVGRSNHNGGGAAEVTTASKIYIPGDPSLTGVRTLEMWLRPDVAPATDGARIGFIDADSTPSAMSFFYYRQGGPTYQVRFEINYQRFINVTLTLGQWVYLAEVCNNGTLISYVNGTQVDSNANNCQPATAAPYGLIIGANNAQNGNKDSEMTGGIDALRIWTTPRTAAEICETSDRTDCP
jgi:hypothetical protein